MVIGLLLILEGVSYALIDVQTGNAWWNETYSTGGAESEYGMVSAKVDQKGPAPSSLQKETQANLNGQGLLIDGSFAVPATQTTGLTLGNTQALAKASQTDSFDPNAVYIPDRIRIPAIELDAPIIPAKSQEVKLEGQLFEQWLAPDERAVGWHPTSATLGVKGNTVLNGHHNVYGEVFKRLVDLQPGDEIIISSGSMDFTYIVANKMILPEKYQKLAVRMANAEWLMPSQDERLTLVTCWPFTSNTHRLIIVAEPVSHRENIDSTP